MICLVDVIQIPCYFCHSNGEYLLNASLFRANLEGLSYSSV